MDIIFHKKQGKDFGILLSCLLQSSGKFVVVTRSMKSHLNLEAPWDEVRERLKEINYELTDEDLVLQPDEPDALINRLAKKLNRTPQEIKQWIESVSHNDGIAS
jgi:hypothetical protein